MFCNLNSFASDEETVEFPGFIAILLWIFRAIIAVVLVSVSFLIGYLIGGQAAALSVETFIFNKYELTSLRVFTGSRVDATSNALFDNVAKWFVILFSLAIIIELLVLLYIAISTVLRTLKQDPRKKAAINKMAKDFVLGLVVLFGMGVFIITVILLNNVIVSTLYKSGNYDGDLTNALTMNLFKGIFDINVMIGTQSLVLYIIISTMGLIFFIYYLKRLLKTAFLIIISPIVAITFAIDRQKGGAKRLLTWTNMFVYTVFVQIVHALTYVAFLTVILSGTTFTSTKFIPSIVLLVAGLKFLWDSETIIGSLFGISADKVQGSAAFLLGLLSQSGRLKKAGKTIMKKAPDLNIRKPSSEKTTASKKLRTKKVDNKKQLAAKGKAGDVKKDLKDKTKTSEKQPTQAKKLTDKDMAKAKLKDSSGKRVVDSLYTKRPFKGLGTAAKEYTITKAKTLGKQTLKRTKESALGLITKATVGSVAAIASHATPQVGMVESGLAGVEVADWGMSKLQTRSHKRRYDGKSEAYKKVLNQEAAQLKAIDERKEKLGKASEKDSLAEPTKKIDEALKDEKLPEAEQESEKTPEKDVEAEKSEKDKEALQLSGEDIKVDELEAYVKDIAATPKKEIREEYTNAKKNAIVAYQERTGESEFKAKGYVEKLQEDLLKEKDFNYSTLEDVDKNLLHKYLNVIAKDKMDDFEHNTQGKIKYKAVLDRTKKI